LKTTLKRSGISCGLPTSIAAPEILMSHIKQLIVLSANVINPDIKTGLRGVARRSMKTFSGLMSDGLI
jgi:hypothetical protein